MVLVFALQTLPVAASPSLAQAVDFVGSEWTSPSHAPFLAQTTTTHDGVDAAESGEAGHSEFSQLQTVFYGPGTIRFWWKVSSEITYDFLEFYIDGELIAQISGEIDWREESFSFPEGAHTFWWRYAKDETESVGSDRGWVDTVRFGPADPLIVEQPQSQFVEIGLDATFRVVAEGTGPFTYQWLKGTEVIPQATQSTYTITNTQLSHAGQYQVRVTGGMGFVLSRQASLAVGASLANALDSSGLAWTTGGNQPWRTQTGTTQDGVDAAQAGPIGDSEQSWIQTTITGPGELRFWVRTSSEDGFDNLDFRINGVLAEDFGLSGITPWTEKVYSLEAGTQVLRWEYSKDDSLEAGEDTAWLDQVRFIPAEPLRILSSGPQFGLTNGGFSFQFVGRGGQDVVVERSTNLVQWTALETNTSSSTFFAAPPLVEGGYFYRLRKL